jgi:hypothetical protein
MNAPHKKGGRSRLDRNSRPDPADPFALGSHQPEDAYTDSRTSAKGREPGSFSQETVATAKGLGESVVAQAANFASHVGEELSATAEAKVASGANALRGFAKAMQTAAQELETQSPEAARHVREAAGRVESFSDNLSNRKVGDLLAAASDFARNQPALFIAGAMLGGFAFARFFKSSGTGAHSETSDARSHGPVMGDNPNAASSANAELT